MILMLMKIQNEKKSISFLDVQNICENKENATVENRFRFQQ